MIPPPSSSDLHSAASACTSTPCGSRIFFIQRSVPPDHSAAGALLFDLARQLAHRGFSPWLLATREPKSAPPREFREGVQIVRVPTLPFSKRHLPFRALALLSAYVSLAAVAVRLPRPALVVTLTDPPLALCLGDLLARLWRCPHFHWCQDVYPEIADAAGLLSAAGIPFHTLRWMSQRIRRRATRVIAIGRCMRERLHADCGGNIRLIPNWSQMDHGTPHASKVRVQLRAEGKFLVLYAGNLGRTHDFEGLLDAAAEFQSLREPVVFGIVGNGPQRGEIERRVASSQLTNVRFLPARPRDEVPAMLAGTDAHLVTLKSEFCGLVVPSKIYDAVGSGRPVIFAGPATSECARLLADHNLGVTVPDRDGHALAQAIRSLRDAPDAFSGAAARFAARPNELTSVDLFERELREAMRMGAHPGAA